MRFTGVASMAALAAVLLPACGAIPLGNSLQSPGEPLEKRHYGTNFQPAAPGESLEKRGVHAGKPAAPDESLEKRGVHAGKPAAPGESLEKRGVHAGKPAAPGGSLEKRSRDDVPWDPAAPDESLE